MMLLARAVGRNEIDRIECLCQEALALDPHDQFALGVLADAYWRNGMHEKGLPFALRTLETTPDDFCALRQVVHAYRDRGDDEAAYPYAKRLCAAVPHTLEPHEEVSSRLKPWSWIPSIRRLRQRAIEEQKAEQSSRTDWTQWAHDYVAWFESQSSTEL
jgi:hypothetical protein